MRRAESVASAAKLIALVVLILTTANMLALRSFFCLPMPGGGYDEYLGRPVEASGKEGAKKQNIDVSIEGIDPFYTSDETLESITRSKQASGQTTSSLSNGSYTRSMVVVRAIGNPLSSTNSSNKPLRFLEYILENEPAFPNTTRHWFLNRITDAQVEKAIVQRLKSSNETYTIIPFSLREYDNVLYSFDSKDTIHSKHYIKRSAEEKAATFVEETVQQSKIRYVANINGARNAMLRYGKKNSAAEYILPWDGHCFLTREAWDAIQFSMQKYPEAKYFTSPIRLHEGSIDANVTEEPQIAFHRTALAQYNEYLRFGRRDKAELLTRIGVKGQWDEGIPWEDWELDFVEREQAADSVSGVPDAGWAACVHSGIENGGKLGTKILKLNRRGHNLSAQLVRLDIRASQELHGLSSSTLLYYKESQLAEERELWKAGKRLPLVKELLELANKALSFGPWSVMDKRGFGCGVSGDCHDYFHVAPYQWPTLNSTGYTDYSKPFVLRDGERAPGTVAFSEGSEKYDRTKLLTMKFNTTVLALAYSVTGNITYARRAAENLRHWFIYNETRMNANINFAQVKWDVEKREMFGSPCGLIEMKDLYFFLDGVKLIEKSGALSESEIDQLRNWFADYLQWLLSSEQGRWQISANNNHGLFYDVQVAPLALYAGNLPLAISRMQRSISRIRRQMNATTGALPHELRRPICEHYQAFTLQGWITMARMAEKIGLNYWKRFADSDAPNKETALCRAVRYANPYLSRRAVCPGNIDGIDARRWQPILLDALHHCPMLDYKSTSGQNNVLIPPELIDPPLNHYEITGLFNMSDGIGPFWNLGLY
uniref:Alginate lyase domain-containing protein n=1 Tax=Phaeodactylum tricornutum TaxID=2850 RepID=A0A8J9S266_PHATR